MTFALSHHSCTKNKARTSVTPTSFFTFSLSLSHTHTHFHSIPRLRRSKFQVPTTQTMVSPTQSWTTQKLTIIMLFLLSISFSSTLEAITSSKKLDQPADTEIKCGSCPCGYTCGEQIPPPPPPPPLPPPLPSPSPPPPPSPSPPPPPSPSPPPPKLQSCSQNCNPMPPPPPRFIYVPVPGNANPAKPYTWIYYYSGAANREVGLLVLAGLGALSITMIFW